MGQSPDILPKGSLQWKRGTKAVEKNLFKYFNTRTYTLNKR